MITPLEVRVGQAYLSREGDILLVTALDRVSSSLFEVSFVWLASPDPACELYIGHEHCFTTVSIELSRVLYEEL